MDLRASRWAPQKQIKISHEQSRVEEDTASISRSEIEKYTRLLRRLNWKASLLFQSYQQATFPMMYANMVPSFLPEGKPWTVVDSESMFKIDFFEFFVLLERLLLHLLDSVGTTVSGNVLVMGSTHGLKSTPPAWAPIAQKPFIFATSGTSPAFSHRFHANVLEALEQPSSPFHNILGTGQVRTYLGIAKECRNRWKDAEERNQTNNSKNYQAKSEEKFLNMLGDVDLEKMLHSITDALNQAKAVLEQQLIYAHAVNNDQHDQAKEKDHLIPISEFGGVVADHDMLDPPWEAMPDTMEWD